MNILITTPIFPPEIGGPATYTVEVARRLQERGHRIRIVAFTDEKPNTTDLEVVPVRIHYKLLGTLRRQTGLLRALFTSVRGTDLIYVQDPMVVGVTSLLAGKLAGKPVALKFVGDTIWEKEYSLRHTDKSLDDFLSSQGKSLTLRLRIYYLGFVLRRMGRIILPSFYLRDILIKHYRVKEDKIAVVYNSVGPETPETARKRQQHRGQQIIFIGRMVRHKRVEGLLRAVRELEDRFPDVNLALAGDGPERKNLENLAGEIGVSQRVQFHGSIAREKALALLKESEVFVLNSIYEGLPHTVIEAMACSVPVVATDIRGTDEAIAHGQTGFLVQPDDGLALADSIARLFEDRELAVEIAKRALAAVGEKYSWESNLPKLEVELAKII